ncbi:multiple cyclophane-containing RiPP AmcA [Micromonospora sp. NPDC048871]|uniref:multiple cyclophane-containing RiPP AmcA n=1 Tax=unclassified Micromonospora TaxID=2617518 RepID=UPI00371EBC0F
MSRQGDQDGCASRRQVGSRPDAPASARAGHSVDRTDDSSFAYRHRGCVGGRPVVCFLPLADGGGLAGRSASPPRTSSGSKWGSAVTVYISRNAKMGDLPRDRSTSASPIQPGPADPPLLTYVWRIVFERQERERDPR